MKGCCWILIVLVGCAVARSNWRPECPSSVDSVFVPHPFDCGKLFYCLRGVAHPVSCPLGARWNQSFSKCDYNTVAHCQRSQSVVGGESSSFELERNAICPLEVGLAGPFYFIPNGDDHQRIIKCVNGYAYILTCAPGQYWNVERNRCDNLHGEEEPQAISMRNILNPNCSVLTDLGMLELIPFFKNVGTLYICQLDKSYVLMIVHLDGTTSTASAGVTSFPSTTPTPSTASTKPTVTTIHPNIPVPMPECSDASSIVRFGIPGECKAYLQCHQGKAYKINCRAGREWSEAEKDCIDASLAGCSSGSTSSAGTSTSSTSATTSSTARPTTARPTTAPTTCSAETQFLPHPYDCRRYIQCDNGKALVRECPHPLFWNKYMFICDWTCE